MSGVYFKRLRGWRFLLFNLCVGGGHALVVFNAGAYIAMLPRVAGGLGIPLSVAAWTQTDYMTGLALGFPVGGWLSRRIGEYRPFAASFLVFALSSACCACATSLPLYLGARIILGFSGGVSLPIGQSLLLKEYPEKQKSLGIGVWNLVTLTPFTLGPPLGGWIADSLGWRWLFWLNIAAALSIAAGVGALLFARGGRAIRRRFDSVGFTLAACTLLGLQTVLNQGNDSDWSNSPYIWAVAGFSVASVVFWVWWEARVKHPYIDIRLFERRNITIGVLVLCCGFLMFQGLLSMLIVQLQVTLGYSSLLAGLVFLPMAIFAKPTAGLMHEIVKRTDARLLASLNLAAFSAVYFWLSQFDDPAAFDRLFWAKLFEGICLGSFFVPLTLLMLHELPAERHWQALELANFLRIAAGGFGISFQAIVLYRRTPLHLHRFAEIHSDAAAPQHLVNAGYSEAAAFAKFAKLVTQAQQIRSINDAYWLAGCVFLTLAALVWFAHPPRKPVDARAGQALQRETDEIVTEEI